MVFHWPTLAEAAVGPKPLPYQGAYSGVVTVLRRQTAMALMDSSAMSSAVSTRL
jgi:hypothetical protein